MSSVTTNSIRPVGLPATDRPVRPSDQKERAAKPFGPQVRPSSIAEELVGLGRQSTPAQLRIHLYSPGDDSKIIPNALGGTLDLKG